MMVLFFFCYDIIKMVNSMSKFIPNMYKKDIFSIDYSFLKDKGIKVLLFDFDNTLIEKGNYIINDKTIKLISKLKKMNNPKKTCSFQGHEKIPSNIYCISFINSNFGPLGHEMSIPYPSAMSASISSLRKQYISSSLLVNRAIITSSFIKRLFLLCVK